MISVKPIKYRKKQRGSLDDYELDEIGMYAKEKITLEGEDKEIFEKLYN